MKTKPRSMPLNEHRDQIRVINFGLLTTSATHRCRSIDKTPLITNACGNNTHSSNRPALEFGTPDKNSYLLCILTDKMRD